MINPIAAYLDISLIVPFTEKRRKKQDASSEQTREAKKQSLEGGDLDQIVEQPPAVEQENEHPELEDKPVEAEYNATDNKDVHHLGHYKHQETKQERMLRRTFSLLMRAALATAAYALAVVYPNFHDILSIIGTTLSFSVSAIFPCAAYLKLFGKTLPLAERVLLYAILVVSVFMVLGGVAWVPFVDNVILR